MTLTALNVQSIYGIKDLPTCFLVMFKSLTSRCFRRHFKAALVTTTAVMTICASTESRVSEKTTSINMHMKP